MKTSDSKKFIGKPKGGVSLVTVPMRSVMDVCNSSANVVVGRVWAQDAGIEFDLPTNSTSPERPDDLFE